ncbi:hypothetical protein [Micromonospora sp. RTGN7]|uniref:hypothetical protein n=1 Tax=Micromonospora sp. RTGN7 TaxID=3016526 RepID=UPI0029FF48E9|nr:hypothetical protein [Micromonospora sp. RTGN7]
MTTDDEQIDEVQDISGTPVDEIPGQLPFDRLDYGDAEQRAEMTGLDEPVAEEPIALVDEPIRIAPPYDRTRTRRNQRPLPT